MRGNGTSYLPVDDQKLDQFTQRANHLLAKVKWTPSKDLFNNRDLNRGGYRESSISSAREEEASLLNVARKISSDPILLREGINHSLTTVRQGLRIGMHLSASFDKASGLDNLVEMNRRGGLSEAQKTEFKRKYETSAAVATFVSAYYIVWELATYRAEEVSNLNFEFFGIPESSYLNPARAIECMLFYYTAYLEKSGLVHSDLDFIKMTLVYFHGVIDEVRQRQGSLNYLELFTSRAYKLKDSDFCVNGFEVLTGASGSSVEFNRVELESIVGNRDAKHKARRLVQRLLCFDRETRRNPMMELGGLTTLRMGHGLPGTGKSLQIAATATMLHDYCLELGIPFLFWPMPDNVVSTFQGGSAERAQEWLRPIHDPNKIVYAPVDDAENNFESRTRQGVSSGVREVIGTFLRHTEGASAVNHGNAVIEIFTNIPEQLDKAVLSRIQDRFVIDGARSREDFLDQDYLWWRKFQQILPDFIDMRDPAGYPYLEAQRQVASIGQTYDDCSEPADERMRQAFHKAVAHHSPDEHDFFARLFQEVRKVYSSFTSRDVRNIQTAVSERIMDFDFEPDWFEDMNLFFLQDYETKKGMIVELMKAGMKGLSFAEMRLQETVRYLDSLAKIVFAEEDRKVDELVEQMRLQQMAAARFQKPA